MDVPIIDKTEVQFDNLSSDLVGSGTSASVHKAVWREQTVAVKKFKQGQDALVIREATMLSLARHPQVVNILGVINNEMIVLEYLEDGSLFSYIQSLEGNQRIKYDLALAIALDITKALNHLHSRQDKIIHLDLKCENIMLYKNKTRAKIVDFGSAQTLSEARKRGGFTPGYAAPEVVEGKKYDNRADIYSLGVILFKLLVGQYPPRDKISRKRRVKESVDDIRFQRLILSCCEHEPSKRPTLKSCLEVLRTTVAELKAPKNFEKALKAALEFKEWFVEDFSYVVMTENDAYVLSKKTKKVRHTALTNRSTIIFNDTFKFHQISASENFFVGLTDEGKIVYWGRQLYSNKEKQVEIAEVAPVNTSVRKFKQVTCSSTTCAAIDDRGRVFLWGDNADNRLRLDEPFSTMQHIYTPVLFPTDIPFAAVSVGIDHRFAISKCGDVYCWGKNTTCQLAIAVETRELFTPKFVVTPFKAQKVVCGDYHTAILLDNRELYLIGPTGHIHSREDFLLRKIAANVKDMACWGDSTAYIVEMKDMLSDMIVKDQTQPTLKSNSPPPIKIGRQRIESTDSILTSTEGTKLYPPKHGAIQIGTRSRTNSVIQAVHSLGPEQTRSYAEGRYKWITFGANQVYVGTKYLKFEKKQKKDGDDILSRRLSLAPIYNQNQICWEHQVAYEGNCEFLRKSGLNFVFDQKDGFGRIPIEIAILQRHKQFFDMMVSNSKQKSKLFLRPKILLRAFEWEYSPEQLNFADVFKVCDEKNITKLLVQVLQRNYGANANIELLYSALHSDCANLFVKPKQQKKLQILAHFLHIPQLFDFFLSVPKSFGGVTTTGIFIQYLREFLLKNTLTESFVNQVHQFFKLSKAEGLGEAIALNYIPIRKQDTKKEKYFIAALLSNRDAQRFILENLNVARVCKKIAKLWSDLPDCRLLLKMFIPEFEDCPNIPLGTVEGVWQGKRCSIKCTEFSKEEFQLFITELVVTR
eukprot:TRINITY_DN3676_c0_g1_i1.p1 TRINITY_DN3676_c0_g1~~TRINITY_DN3676_c0_g1_i1.p1  ORF type:complete len:979 (-),score=31.26 TRINITY_DN3676_c0_g1_i1:652-3588(-)